MSLSESLSLESIVFDDAFFDAIKEDLSVTRPSSRSSMEAVDIDSFLNFKSSSVGNMVSKSSPEAETSSSAEIYKQPYSTVACDRLFVAKIPDVLTKEDIRNYFSMYGYVVDVYFVPKKGFAFVQFESMDIAEYILSLSAVHSILGYDVVVDRATTKEQSPTTLSKPLQSMHNHSNNAFTTTKTSQCTTLSLTDVHSAISLDKLLGYITTQFGPLSEFLVYPKANAGSLCIHICFVAKEDEVKFKNVEAHTIPESPEHGFFFARELVQPFNPSAIPFTPHKGDENSLVHCNGDGSIDSMSQLFDPGYYRIFIQVLAESDAFKLNAVCLRNHFSQFGKLKDVFVPKSRPGLIAFVEYFDFGSFSLALTEKYQGIASAENPYYFVQCRVDAAKTIKK